MFYTQNDHKHHYSDCLPRLLVAKEKRLVSTALDRSKDIVLRHDFKKNLIAMLPRLRRFAISLTRSADEADDLVQEACLRAISRSNQWDSSQPLDRWVFRVMRNLWISEIRKRQVRLGHGHVQAEESNELVDVETAEEILMGSQLYGQIGTLSEELATVLLIVSVEGYSYAEAAELLDIPIGTVMSRIHRARKLLCLKINGQKGVSQ